MSELGLIVKELKNIATELKRIRKIMVQNHNMEDRDVDIDSGSSDPESI